MKAHNAMSFRAVRCAMLAAALFLVPTTILSAQAAPAASPQALAQASQFEKASASASHISLSFSLQEWGNEFGMGVQITSPWFIHEKVAVRLGGAAVWKQDAHWTPYYALRGGLVGASFMKMRISGSMEKAGSYFSFPILRLIATPLCSVAMGILALNSLCRRSAVQYHRRISSSSVQMA